MKVKDVVDWAEDRTGWDVAVCSSVGSRNYDLHTEDSDFDFIVFVVPPAGADDKETEFKGVKLDDIPINDLRKLPERLWKSYPLDVEIVFPKERYMCREMDPLLYGNRERIARMNLPEFYERHMRKYKEYSKNLTKVTANTQELVEKYGYDSKNAMHAFRMLHVLQVFADTGSFEKAVRYEGSEREFFMDIRKGKFGLEDIREKLEQKHGTVEDEYKDRYLGQETDTAMFEILREGIDSFISRI
jgi:hypothetical protein